MKKLPFSFGAHKGRINKILVEENCQLADYPLVKSGFEINLAGVKSTPSLRSANMKKYLTEKNALTVATSIFCFVMMIIAIKNDGNLWEAIAFALAFSFSVELICHRSKEHK